MSPSGLLLILEGGRIDRAVVTVVSPWCVTGFVAGNMWRHLWRVEEVK